MIICARRQPFARLYSPPTLWAIPLKINFVDETHRASERRSWSWLERRSSRVWAGGVLPTRQTDDRLDRPDTRPCAQCSRPPPIHLFYNLGNKHFVLLIFAAGIGPLSVAYTRLSSCLSKYFGVQTISIRPCARRPPTRNPT